jgi:hypothetical protein
VNPQRWRVCGDLIRAFDADGIPLALFRVKCATPAEARLAAAAPELRDALRAILEFRARGGFDITGSPVYAIALGLLATLEDK